MPKSDIVAAGLLKFGCNGWFKISRELNRDCPVDRALFEQGVVALGWGNWHLMSRSFFSGSRDRIQLRTQALVMERSHPETKQRLIDEHAARHAFDDAPVIPTIEVAMPGTDPAFNKILTSDNTTAEDTIIKSMPAIDDTPLAVDYTTAFYEMTTIILNEPDNEQIEIVAV